jgi:hypothetical protein
MRWKVGLSTTCVVLWAAMSSVYADRYDCEAVVSGARLGVFRNNAVNVVIDSGRKECRFSVNGATAGSPPLDKVLEGFNAIADRSMVGLLKEGRREPLANALLAASRLDGVPGNLLTRLSDFSQQLVNCFSDFADGKIGFLVIKEDLMSCAVVGPRREVVKIRQLSVVNDGPQLQLMMVLGEETMFLFVPLNYRQGLPPLRP